MTRVPHGCCTRGSSSGARAVLRRRRRSRHARPTRSRTPDAARAIVDAADSIVAGRFDLLGYRGLGFGDPIDWHLDPVNGRRAPLVHWSRIDALDRRRWATAR